MSRKAAKLALVAAAVLYVSPVLAQDVRAEMFQHRKNMESQSHHARIDILKQAESCIQTAQTPQAYKACEQQEREARQSLRQGQQQQLQDRIAKLEETHPKAAARMKARMAERANRAPTQ